VTSKLELLDDLSAFVHIQDDTSGRYTEAGVLVAQRLNAAETSIRSNQRPVKGSEAVHVLWSVLEHTVSSS